jgi:hypothetical protein
MQEMGKMASKEREQHAHWMRQAAACRRSYAKTGDRYWAQATRSSVAAARSHREA